MSVRNGFTGQARSRPALVAAIYSLSLLTVACGGGTTTPEPVASTLVRAEAEPAGTHCSSGGTAILTGRDVSGNGVLDATEVDASATQYICNTESLRSLVAFSPEPRGSNCPYGGTRIQGGLDANSDGALAESEVASTDYLCNSQMDAATYVGSFVVTNSADLARLAGVEVVTGRLEIHLHPELLSAVLLPELKEVRESLYLWPNTEYPASMEPDALSIRFPALQHVGDLEIDLTNVGVLEMPELKRVEDELDLWGNQGALETVRFAKLETVVNRFQVSDLRNVRAVELPALAAAYSLRFRESEALVNVDAPVLARLERLELQDLPAMETVSFALLTSLDDGLTLSSLPLLSAVNLPSLQRVGSLGFTYMNAFTNFSFPAITEVEFLEVQGNELLTSFSLPALEVLGAVYVNNNPVLETLSLPFIASIASTNWSYIQNNPSFNECEVRKLQARLLAGGSAGGFQVSGNKADASCSTNTADTCAPLVVKENGTTHHYSFCVVPRNFAGARADCQALATDADLAVFETEAEFTAVREMLYRRTVDGQNHYGPLFNFYSWVGLSDDAVPGTFAWVNGSTSYLPGPGFWASNEPSATYACGRLLNGNHYGFTPAGGGAAVHCGNVNELLCELPSP